MPVRCFVDVLYTSDFVHCSLVLCTTTRDARIKRKASFLHFWPHKFGHLRSRPIFFAADFKMFTVQVEKEIQIVY